MTNKVFLKENAINECGGTINEYNMLTNCHLITQRESLSNNQISVTVTIYERFRIVLWIEIFPMQNRKIIRSLKQNLRRTENIMKLK